MVKKLRLGFFIGAFILVIDAAIPLILTYRIASVREAIDEIEFTRYSLNELLSAYKDAETGQRGFALTGRQAFLEPYIQGRSTIEKLLSTLQSKLHGDELQTRRFTDLLELDRQEAAHQKQLIEQRNESNWSNIEASERGKAIMDRLRAQIADLSTAERERSDALVSHAAQLQRWSLVSLIAITTLDLVLFAIIFLVMARSTRAERSTRDALAELNNNLTIEISLRAEAMSRLEQQSKQLSQVVQIQSALAETQLDIDAFMNEVVQGMLAVVPTTGAVIEIIEGEQMVYATASGSIAQFVGLRIPRRGSLSGLCVEKAEVMISADTNNDERVDRAACAKIGVAAMIVAPLLRAGEPIGVVKIVSDLAHSFDDSALQTLRLMAGFLGAALGNQLQYQKNQTLLSERTSTLAALESELLRRKEYEYKLLHQQQILHTLTNAIPALIALIDTDEIFRYCNDECIKIFGLKGDEIIGRSLREFSGEKRYLESKQYIEKALAGEAVVFEYTADTAVGLRHQECRLIPDFDNHDKPNGFYLIAWDVTERKAQETEWKSRALIDPLTDLLNRSSFTDALNHTLQHHKHASSNIAVLYLDIDRFKHINDTYGHAAGDVLLQKFSRYLKHSVRESDVVCRLGGDEFCILLNDVKTPDNASAIAEKILTSVRAPIVFENHTLAISTSIGIAFVQQLPIDSAHLIALADAALYQAKQAGRNRYVLNIVSSA